MSCGCEEYVCLQVVPQVGCIEEIQINLPATETGQWIMSLEFNGGWINKYIDVEEGVNILLPNYFNENYSHTIKFYNTENELVNDTCYRLNTSKVGGTGSIMPTPPAPESITYYEYVVVAEPDGFDDAGRWEIEAGVTITDNRLIGKGVSSIVISGGQSYNSGDYTKTTNSNTLTMTNGSGFGLTTIITAYVY